MLARSEAQALANVYQKTVAFRIEQALRACAQVGIVGMVFTWTTNDDTAVLNQVKTDLQSAGWTVVLDLPNKTATIS